MTTLDLRTGEIRIDGRTIERIVAEALAKNDGK